MANLYVFIDESGNFDFSAKGTKYFVMCAITALNPITSSQILQSLKYRLLGEGIDIDYFHASPDLQYVRDYVFDEIEKLNNIRINYVYAKKQNTHPNYQSPEAFYSLFGKTLLKYVLNSWLASQYDQVVVIFDKALTKGQQRAFLGVVKPELKSSTKPYKIYFHKTIADFNAQIADYCSWAKYVGLAKSERRPINKLKTIPTSSFDIFRKGKIEYY